MSIQTQEVFRKLTEDTIIQNDQTLAVSNMRTAINDTNVVLNMAISPGVVLIPSNMIILTEMIAGYNNILTLASGGMRFGENDGVNRYNTDSSTPTTPTTPTIPTTPTARDTESKSKPESSEAQVKTYESSEVVSDNPNTSRSEMYLLVITLIGGSLVSRFIV